MSVFSKLPEAIPDASFSLIAAYREDDSPKKVDLCPGFYRDSEARPWILPSVGKAEEILHFNPSLDHEHLPQLGHPGLLAGAKKIVFGDADTSRVACIQTVSGTGSNHLAARFLAETLQPKNVWFSDPTWINHPEIWAHDAPSVRQRTYPYFNEKTFSLNLNGMLQTLREEAERGDVIILHACAHNPTGLDPTREEWELIGQVCEEKGLFAVFDSAYQGFASGSVPGDAFAMRHFSSLQNGTQEFAVAQSFSKNFGLYGERVGTLQIATKDKTLVAKVEGRLKQIARAEYTTCPSYGARVIATILERDELRQQWYEDLNTMSRRMKDMRQQLYDQLKQNGTPGDWEHLLSNIGMFSMTGLSKEQCLSLKSEHHVYLLPSGRLSVTGLTTRNVQHVADSIDQVLKKRR